MAGITVAFECCYKLLPIMSCRFRWTPVTPPHVVDLAHVHQKSWGPTSGRAVKFAGTAWEVNNTRGDGMYPRCE